MVKKKNKNKKQEKKVLLKVKSITVGMSLIILSVLLLAAIYFYYPTDNSFNIASDNVANVLGAFGASSASFILSFVGLSLPIFLIVVMMWGYKLCRLQKINYIWLRLGAWIVGLLSTSVFLNVITFKQPLGGALGRLISIKLESFLPSHLGWIVTLIAFGIGFLSFNYAINLPLKNTITNY